MTGIRHSLALALAVPLTGSALLLPAGPALAMPVFDASNHAQNLLQAARALEQINHQISSLQNEAAMLRNMARNLERIDFPQFSRMTGALERIDGLMGRAEGIGFAVDRLDERIAAAFPAGIDETLPSGRRVADARSRLEAAMEGFRHAMRVQSQVVANIEADSGTLGELVARSQGAVGQLQAQQAANQLLALAAKQQLQLQALLAAEYRSRGLEEGRRLQAEAEARAATRRFIGSGKAYSPR